MKKKNSIKRAQSQARLSFAERLRVGELCSGMRKNFRPMAKILTLLVLLMTAVTGAWAQEVTLLTTIENTGDNASFTSGSKTFDNIATVTFSGTVYNDDDDWGWYADQERTLTVTAAEGYTITRVKFYNKSGSAFDEEAPFEAILVDNGSGNFTKVNGTSIGEVGVNKIEVYGYAGTPAPAADPDYYLVGNMTSWGIYPQYKLALNESAGDANEYQIALALPAATELKVVSSTDGTTIKDWFPAEAGNKYVQNDGLYTIYFRPDYNGGDDWHANCIYVADGVSFTADGTAWTLAQMPACDVELEVEYYPLATLATTPAAAEGLNDATTADLLTAGTSNDGTLYYALGTSEAPTGQWSLTIPTTEGLEAGTCYVWYKVVGDAEHSDSEPQCIAVTIAAMPAFAVTIDDAGVDASNWQATPAEPKTGQTVTLSYGGKKKVKSITIEKVETTPAGPTLAETLTTAGMTVKVTYNYNWEVNYCQFTSNGDGTYTFQSGGGNTGGYPYCAKALVVEDGKLVFKQNIYSSIDDDWGNYGFSVTFDTGNNTYSQWAGEYAKEEYNPSFISVEVNGTQIAVTQQ